MCCRIAKPSLEVNINDLPPSSTMCVFAVCFFAAAARLLDLGSIHRIGQDFTCFCFCSKNLSWSMAVLWEFIFLNQLFLPMQKTLAVENVVKMNY